MSKTCQAMTVVAGGLLLAGCHSMGGTTARLNAGIRVPEQASGRLQAETQLAAGKAALATHNYATAIAALREAALEPDLAGAAHNGLGVAYAGIGRSDIAERYFRQAIAEDPAEQRYADNLVRFYRSRLAAELDRRERLEAQRLAAVEAEQRNRDLGMGLRTRGPEPGMIRISRTEVVLRSSASPAAAPQMLVGALASVQDMDRTAPAIAPSLAQARPGSPTLRKSEPVPAQPRQDKPQIAIATDTRREVVNHLSATAAEPSAAAISTTGRRYENRAASGPALAQSDPVSRPVLTTTGRLVPVPTLAATIVEPMRNARLTLGQSAPEQPAEKLALVTALPKGLEPTAR